MRKQHERPILAFVLAIFLLVTLSPIAHAESGAGYNSAIQFMISELKKQDTVTLADAVSGLWRERIHNDSMFCRMMEQDSSVFRLWLAGMKQTAFVATTDSAARQLELWRGAILDTSYGPFAGLKPCKSLDSQVLDLFRNGQIQRATEQPSLTKDQAIRKAIFWFSQWKNRSGVRWRDVGPPLFDVLLAYPNELYDLFSGSRAEFNQFLGALDDIRFTGIDKATATTLETVRQNAITRLGSGVVGGRFTGLNAIVIERLRKIKVRQLP
jgi:hypothetical protein